MPILTLEQIIEENPYLKHYTLSETFMREYADMLDWGVIFYYRKLQPSLIEEFSHKADDKCWKFISEKQTLPEPFIRKYHDKLDWKIISNRQKLSESIIAEFQDKVDWRLISGNQKLSLQFMRKFKDKIDWSMISCRQSLSESFIRDYQHRVDWENIAMYQKLSYDFIVEMEDKIDFYLLLSRNFSLDPKIVLAYIGKTNITQIRYSHTANMNERQREELHKIIRLKQLFKK